MWCFKFFFLNCFLPYLNHFSFFLVHFQSREVTSIFRVLRAACREVVDPFRKRVVSSANCVSLNSWLSVVITLLSLLNFIISAITSAAIKKRYALWGQLATTPLKRYSFGQESTLQYICSYVIIKLKSFILCVNVSLNP